MATSSGAIGRKAEEWRRDLIRAATLLEATIDFADEEEVEEAKLLWENQVADLKHVIGSV